MLRRRRAMRRRDARRILDEAKGLLDDDSQGVLGQAELEDGTEVYLINGEALLARKEKILFPTLLNPVLNGLPSAVVDMGAIPYVCNGADVMAPGIKEVRGEFEESALIVVRDITHGKPLAIGLTLFSSEEMKEMGTGKALRNIHYVGDRLWNAIS